MLFSNLLKKFVNFFHPFHLVEILVLLGFLQQFRIVRPQMIILPGPGIDDAFKENPKWKEFLLYQAESIDTLKTLVTNVWNLIDSIPNPSNKTNLEDSFVKFHVPEFIHFFGTGNERVHAGNPFPVTATAFGRHNMADLILLANRNTTLDPLTQLRLEWLAVEEAASIVHNIFNSTSDEILKDEEEFYIRIVQMATEDRFPLWGAKFLGAHESGWLTLAELSELINKDIVRRGFGKDQLLRTFLTLLTNMRQSLADQDEHLNYFCYGNNEFGIIPDVFDVVADTATFLVMADMKQLVINVYVHAVNTFFNEGKRDTESVQKERNAMWTEMLTRIHRKVNFPFLEGTGWTHPAGPVIFKCDLPPKNILGEMGQWGRNISTGAKPNASPTVPYDPQAGPMRENGTVGYFDQRIPQVEAVGFENTFKGYIESELALDPTSSCRNTCRTFKRPTPLCLNTPHHCPLYRESHCRFGNATNLGCMRRNQCPQSAMNCQRTGREVRMCPSTKPNKLYDWISYDGRVIDPMKMHDVSQGYTEPPCANNITTAHERWEMENGVVLRTPRYCELCFCTCMTPFDTKDQEYFDLGPLVSNTEKGFIVSGVRFVKNGNTIGMAIEQGKPIVGGYIDESTLEWIDKPHESTPQLAEFGADGFLRVNFDLILGETGTVVTGLRFRCNDTERSLNLEIQTTPIHWPEQDASSISLRHSESKWIPANPQPREPILMANPYDSRRQKGPSMPDSVLNSYVELRSSSFESDLGQTIVPLFDAQPVFYYERRNWLRGLGIMHKGKPGSGGFISPIIVPASPYKSFRFHPTPTNDTIIGV